MKHAFLEQVAAAVVGYLVLAYLVGQNPQLKSWIQQQWSTTP